MNYLFRVSGIAIALFVLFITNANAQFFKTVHNLNVDELTEMKVNTLRSFFALEKKDIKKADVILKERYAYIKEKTDTSFTDDKNTENIKAFLAESSEKLRTEILLPAIDKTTEKRIKSIGKIIDITPEQELALAEIIKPIYSTVSELYLNSDKRGMLKLDSAITGEFRETVKTHLRKAFKKTLVEEIRNKAKKVAEPYIKQLNLPTPQHATLVAIIAIKIEGNIKNSIIYSNDKSSRKSANKELNAALKLKISNEFLTDEYVEIQVRKITSIFKLSSEKKDTLTSIFADQLAELRTNKKEFGANPETLKEKNKKSKKNSIARIDKSVLNDAVEESTKTLMKTLNKFAKMPAELSDTTTIITSEYFKEVKTLFLQYGDEDQLFKQKLLDVSAPFAIMICTDVLAKVIEGVATEKAKKYIKILKLSDEQSEIIAVILVQQVKGMLINTIAYKNDKPLQEQKNKELNSNMVYRLKTEVLTESQRKKIKFLKL